MAPSWPRSSLRLALQRAGRLARGDLGVLEPDHPAGLPAEFDLSPRGDLLDRAQPLLEAHLIDRVLRAQRVALGDRLRFGQRRLQARARLRETARAARDRGRRRQRQERGDQKPDARKNRLLDQFRCQSEAEIGRHHRMAAADQAKSPARAK